LLFFCTLGGLVSCDRGAGNQIEAARQFSDAVTRNNAPKRDSMIATYKYREFFKNDFIASDMISWFRTFYDYQDGHFRSTARADVDNDLSKQLAGALIDTNAIEETGSVRVKSPRAGEDPAYFLLVRQHGSPWRVAFVTKGEIAVNFK
jgi:hypothetical protein